MQSEYPGSMTRILRSADLHSQENGTCFKLLFLANSFLDCNVKMANLSGAIGIIFSLVSSVILSEIIQTLYPSLDRTEKESRCYSSLPNARPFQARVQVKAGGSDFMTLRGTIKVDDS